MLKRSIAIITVFIASLPTAFAGTFYAGPVITYQSIRGGSAHFEGLSPRILAGYRMGFWGFYFIGGEIYAGGTIVSVINHKEENTPQDILNGSNPQDREISLKNTYVYGIGITPGVILDEELMLYLRIGAVGTKFKQSGGNIWGYQIGIGAEVSATNTVGLRGEFDYNQYSKANGINTPKAYEYSISAIYKFGC